MSSTMHRMNQRPPYSFVYNIWKDTYDTDKWKDPNEIIDRLNSPHLFDLFFRDNIAYDFDKLLFLFN